MFDIEGSSADPAGAANAPSPRQGTTPAVPRRALLLALPLALAACGKKGAPSPPGPPEKVIYPRVYPAR